MADAVKTAEAALATLEAPKHRLAHARQDRAGLDALGAPTADGLRAAHAAMYKLADDETEAAQAALTDHEATHGGAAPLQRKIDQAAQAVLDARGEAHTDQDFKKAPDHAE